MFKDVATYGICTSNQRSESYWRYFDAAFTLVLVASAMSRTTSGLSFPCSCGRLDKSQYILS